MSLNSKAAAKGLFFGSAFHAKYLPGGSAPDAAYVSAIQADCGLISAEAGQMSEHETAHGVYNFTNSDALLAFAQANGMKYRDGHLVWYSGLPAWLAGVVVDANSALTEMTNYINTMCAHFKGNVHSWNVVNESVAPWEAHANGLRGNNNPWWTYLGETYIDSAFTLARAADPNALLILNNNHCEYNSAASDTMRADCLALIDRMQSRGTPIDGFGIQAHLQTTDGSFDSGKFWTFLCNLASRGLKIMITELDVTDQDPTIFPEDAAARDAVIAKKYQEFLGTALLHPAVIGVQCWEFSDKYSWISTSYPRADSSPNRPLPLDTGFNQKPAYAEIARALDNCRNSPRETVYKHGERTK